MKGNNETTDPLVNGISATFVVVLVLNDLDGDDDRNDDNNHKEDTEANPTLFTRCTCGDDSLLGISQAVEVALAYCYGYQLLHVPSACVGLDLTGRCLDDVDRLILLLDENTHLEAFLEDMG